MRMIERQPGLVFTKPSAAGVLVKSQDIRDPLSANDMPRTKRWQRAATRINAAKRNQAIRKFFMCRDRGLGRLWIWPGLGRNQRQHDGSFYSMKVHHPDELVGQQRLTPNERSKMR